MDAQPGVLPLDLDGLRDEANGLADVALGAVGEVESPVGRDARVAGAAWCSADQDGTIETINPTAEAIAAWFFRELKPQVAEITGSRAELARVRLWETPEACVTYSEDRAPDR